MALEQTKAALELFAGSPPCSILFEVATAPKRPPLSQLPRKQRKTMRKGSNIAHAKLRRLQVECGPSPHSDEALASQDTFAPAVHRFDHTCCRCNLIHASGALFIGLSTDKIPDPGVASPC